MKSNRPQLSDILAAHRAMRGVAVETPVIRSTLGRADAPLWMKLETLQPSGAFKLRGAANAVAQLSDDAKLRGVVCCSTGNHGTALAYAARQMGVPATVCVSELVPEVKVNAIEAQGARVVQKGQSQDDAQLEANRLVAEEGVTDIPPFDNFNVVAGQGTIGLELLRDLPELECLLVPLSGGGLAAGIAIAAKTIKPSIRIVGISMDRGAAMAESLRAGKPIEVTELPSLADSLGGGIGLDNQHTFEVCLDLLDDVILLTEGEIYRGMQTLFSQDRIVAEGASAVGHAAVLAGKVTLTGPTATIISGRNVDMDQFTKVVTGQPVCLGKLTVTGE
jgi:threonine dehydratase